MHFVRVPTLRNCVYLVSSSSPVAGKGECICCSRSLNTMHKPQWDSRPLNHSLTSNLQHHNLIDSVHPCLMRGLQHSAFMVLRCQIPDTLSGLISIREPQQTLDGHGDETGERGRERKKCFSEISASAEVVDQPFSSYYIYLKPSSKGHTASTCWDEKRNSFADGMRGPQRPTCLSEDCARFS